MKWDTYTICVTVLVLVLIATSSFMLVKVQPKSSWWILCFIYLALLAVFLYMPYKVGYNDKAIYVQRIKGRVEIPFDSILSVEQIGSGELLNSVRIFGSGGFLGNIGYFKNEKFGTYIMYTTSSENLVRIKTETKMYVINFPDTLLADIKDKLNGF
ncbi:MAG: PH domain-containing protein [Roseburia sp.]|nr:PH domain-containing protein [Roseburia sp.]